MSELQRLQKTFSLADFAELLGYKPQALSYILYKIPPDKKYTAFQIPKKSGGMREIKAPCERLKQLQTRLNILLSKCFAEINDKKFAENGCINNVSFGFRKKQAFENSKGKKIPCNYSIAENAKKHKKRRWVLNLDLKDFFPSFNFGRVRGFFIKDRNFNLQAKVATLIAQIACDGKALPQGSPCSPIISVLLGQILDMRLVRLAKKYKVTYTRYADDIVFSTNQRKFPQELAEQVTEGNWRIGEKLEKAITNAGFSVNDKKTRMAFRRKRQQVTGLVVNSKVNVASDYYRRARAMCHNLFMSGGYYLKNSGNIAKPDEKEESLNRLNGILSFIDSVRKYDPKLGNDKDKSAFMKLYKTFLVYKHCIDLEKPLIITEGKTDIVHLRCAIKKLGGRFPLLGSVNKKVNADGKDIFDYKISFLKHNGKRSSKILVGGGGTSSLKEIPLAYLAYKEYFSEKKTKKICKPKYPVIIILDNDNGTSEQSKKHGTILGTIKKNFPEVGEINTENPKKNYPITKNLYLIIMEKGQDGKDRAIEDLYLPEWRNRKLEGKSFNPANKSDSKQNPPNTYGKDKFAREVIAANLCKMTEADFSEFVPLLESIKSVIEDYGAKNQ